MIPTKMDSDIIPSYRRACIEHRVTITNADKGAVMCDNCKMIWWADIRPHSGTWYRGWWKCTNGCNAK